MLLLSKFILNTYNNLFIKKGSQTFGDSISDHDYSGTYIRKRDISVQPWSISFRQTDCFRRGVYWGRSKTLVCTVDSVSSSSLSQTDQLTAGGSSVVHKTTIQTPK